MKTILFVGADAAYLYDFRLRLMQAFLQRGYRVIAFSAVDNDFDIGKFEAIGVEFRPWRMRRAALDPISDLKPMLALWRILREVRPEIMFAHTIKPVIYGMIVGWLAGVKRRTAMIPGLGYAFSDDRRLKRRLVELAGRIGYRLALSLAHMVIFQNRDDLALLKRLNALPASTPTGVANGSGVDLEVHRSAPWPPTPVSFLMVARLLRDKGVLEFVEAARMVRREFLTARFVLLGRTDSNPASLAQSDIDAWVAEGLIEAPGYVADPRAAFEACHVFVLPSYYREGCPRVNLEAMATGRAVITTDWAGCRDTVRHGETGLLVPPRDAAALGEAMLTLARDLDRAREFGEAGRRMCLERFEIAAVTEATASFVEGV